MNLFDQIQRHLDNTQPKQPHSRLIIEIEDWREDPLFSKPSDTVCVRIWYPDGSSEMTSVDRYKATRFTLVPHLTGRIKDFLSGARRRVVEE